MSAPLILTDRGCHRYLIAIRDGFLLFDPGWAGSLGQLLHGLKAKGIDPKAIRYVMFSHHDPDHAGLTQEVKDAWGARLLIHRVQIPFLKDLEAFYARKGSRLGDYAKIIVSSQDVILEEDNRGVLAGLGIAGQAVLTPGHTDDSLTLVLDDGSAFTGDLHPPSMVAETELPATLASWDKIRRLGARTIYPGHGQPFALGEKE